MESSASGGSPTQPRRAWVVLLYFYLAALVGLGFVITGATNMLFGAKAVAFPELEVATYNYDSSLRRDPQGNIIASDPEREAARQRAIDDQRRQGLDDLADGIILVAVGTPTLIWHFRRGQRTGREPN